MAAVLWLQWPAREVRRPVGRPVIESGPKVAIILDDLGEKKPEAEAVFQLDLPLTVAVLPRRKYSEVVADHAATHGFEVLLHLPMEAVREAQNFGEDGMIFTRMSLSEVREEIFRDLETVPGAVGANNHKGSKATTDKKTMEWVLQDLKRRGMFFVDSRTSRHSVVAQAAKDIKTLVLVNEVFLDGVRQEGYVARQLQILVERAKKDGVAVGIGHVTSKPTIAVLEREIPRYMDQGINFVYAHELISPSTSSGQGGK